MTQEAAETKGPSRRRMARLAAVQALYQMDLSGAGSDAVLLEFLEHRLGEEIDGLRMAELDRGFFTELVRGVSGQRAKLERMLAGVLTADWPLERLESVVRVILLTGAYELAHCPDIPAKVTINEYLEIAHGFFSGKEPGLVNGVLDRLARSLRQEEFGGLRHETGT
jgi:N utilization substance protein B